jgi:F-type H+-transporting ATPase subunit alpha
VLDDLPLDQIRAFEQELYRFLENAHPAILTTIKEKKTIDDELKPKLNSALQEFKTRFIQDQSHKNKK